MIVRNLAHVCVHCPDLVAATEFYVEVLGFRKVFNFTKDGRVVGVYLEISPYSFIELFENAVDLPEKPRLSHFALETDDIEAAQARLRSKGVVTTEIKRGGDGTLQFWLSDPAQTAIEFHQYTTLSSQKTGQDVEMDWAW